MQSVPITTNVVSSNPAQARSTLIQHYVIKIISDLRQVNVFLRVLQFPPPIKLSHNITEILLKVVLNIINLDSSKWHIHLRNKSWKQECVLSFILASMIYFDSDMYKYSSILWLENDNLYLRLRTMSHTIYAAKFEQTIIHQHLHLRRESQSHASVHVPMRLYPIDKLLVCLQSERRTSC